MEKRKKLIQWLVFFALGIALGAIVTLCIMLANMGYYKESPAYSLNLTALQDEAGEYVWPYAAWNTPRELLEADIDPNEMDHKSIQINYPRMGTWSCFSLPGLHEMVIEVEEEIEPAPFQAGGIFTYRYGGICDLNFWLRSVRREPVLTAVSYEYSFYSRGDSPADPNHAYLEDLPKMRAVYLDRLTELYGAPDETQTLPTTEGGIYPVDSTLTRYLWKSASGKTGLCLRILESENYAVLGVEIGLLEP